MYFKPNSKNKDIKVIQLCSEVHVILTLGRLREEGFPVQGKPGLRNAHLRNKKRAGEMAQWVKVLIAEPDDLGSIPRAHIVAQNHL